VNDSDEQAHALPGHAGRLSAENQSHSLQHGRGPEMVRPSRNRQKTPAYPARPRCRRHPAREKATISAACGQLRLQTKRAEADPSFPLVVRRALERGVHARDGHSTFADRRCAALTSRSAHRRRRDPRDAVRGAGWRCCFASAAYRPPRSGQNEASRRENSGGNHWWPGFAPIMEKTAELDDAIFVRPYFPVRLSPASCDRSFSESRSGKESRYSGRPPPRRER